MEKLFNKIAKFNYWQGETHNTGFVRDFYLQNIIKFTNNKLIKVIVGQRRVGKSYILRQIIEFLIKNNRVNPKNIFYLNKEYLVFDSIKTVYDLEEIFEYYKKKFNIKEKVYIFIDEIQNITGWEKFVNSYAQDYTEKYELFISGSNSNLLSGELSTLLSGRYIKFEILPFDLFEYSAFNNLDINKQSFLNYLKTGGLPEIIHFKEEDIKQNYIFSLKDTIILRDIINRHNIKDIALLEDIFKFICTNIGHLSSFTSIIKYFKSKQKKTNYETISNYVNYLKNTFIIHEVERYNLRGKQILGGERKFYLNDLAFKTYLLGYFPDDIGNYLENFVFLQLKRYNYDIKVAKLYNKEIDFVAKKSDKTIYIQVAYLLTESETVKREFGNLLNIKDNFEKIVISLDDSKFSDYKGIKHIRPWELANIL